MRCGSGAVGRSSAVRLHLMSPTDATEIMVTLVSALIGGTFVGLFIVMVSMFTR
jgi:hypothetical protein